MNYLGVGHRFTAAGGSRLHPELKIPLSKPGRFVDVRTV